MNTLQTTSTPSFITSLFDTDPFFKQALTTFHPELTAYRKTSTGANLYENKDGDLVAELAMAGFNKNNIDITLDGDSLIVRGYEKSETNEQDEDNRYFHRGMSVGEMSRSFSLPYDVSEEDVKATYENGILTVLMKKAEQPQSKRIAIS
jgi:HSP20 family protein